MYYDYILDGADFFTSDNELKIEFGGNTVSITECKAEDGTEACQLTMGRTTFQSLCIIFAKIHQEMQHADVRKQMKQMGEEGPMPGIPSTGCGSAGMIYNPNNPLGIKV